MKHLFTLLFTCASVITWGQGVGTYEGFFKQEVDGAYFFFEVRNDSLLPSRKVIFKDVDKTKVDSIAYYQYVRSDVKKAVVTGVKINEKVSYIGLPYNQIIITGIKEVSAQEFLDFYHINKERIITPYIEDVFEGFYFNYYEGQSFLEKHIDDAGGFGISWITFQDRKQRDSIIQLFTHKYKYDKKDALIKVKGRLYYGGMYGYGHFGGCTSELKVEQVLAVDTETTYDSFLLPQLIKGYPIHGDTLFPPNDFVVNKTYRYTGTANDSLGHCTFEMLLTKKSVSDLRYTFKLLRGRKKIFEQRGTLVFSSSSYLKASQPKKNEDTQDYYQTDYTYHEVGTYTDTYRKEAFGLIIDLEAGSPPPVLRTDCKLGFKNSGWEMLELKLQN
ncbi:hypothetical protein ACLI1A_13395 [Flavobacterium sp. RHBU_3]|uniref:hypothetical protein n=1 Tax=Flavobacterium sp. RHBU_3 TaxID=3391184 RepID=UPI003984AC7C